MKNQRSTIDITTYLYSRLFKFIYMARVRKPPSKKTKQTIAKTQKQSRVNKVLSSIGRFFKLLLKPLKVLKKPFQNKFFRPIGRFFSKVLLINYITSSWKEVRQVTWPDRKQTGKLTLAVFIFAITFGAFVAVIDFGLDKLFKEVVL